LLPNVTIDAITGTPRPGSLYYRHPRYDLTWWWREFGRVSYVGGREYHRPSLLSVDFQYPILAARNANGQLIDPNQKAFSGIADDAARCLLFRHNREQSWEFENRRKRATYHNMVRPTVNSLVSHTLKKGVTRDEGNPDLTTFWGEVDEDRSQDIDTFVRDGLRPVLTMGIMWACVDVQAAGGADPDADGLPYAYWVSPLDIFDWSVDEDGEIEWLKQFVCLDLARTPRQQMKSGHRFRIWYRDHVEEYDVVPGGGGETRLPDRPNPLGRVPFEPLYITRCDDTDFPDGEALVADFCKGANRVYNYGSLLDEIYYKQTFSWLCVPDPNVDVLQAGVNTVFGFNPQGTSAMPQYVSPDPEQARVLSEGILATMDQMKESLGTGRGTLGRSMQKSSAAAMELENEDKRSILGDIASAAEDFEKRLAVLVLAYRTSGIKASIADLPHIQYPQDFDLQALQDEINEVVSMRLLGLSPAVMLELRRQMVARKFAGMPPDKLAPLLDSLQNVEAPPVDTTSGTGQVTTKKPNQAAPPGQGNGSHNPGQATGAAEPG